MKMGLFTKMLAIHILYDTTIQTYTFLERAKHVLLLLIYKLWDVPLL